jgi:hypothetical protein
MTRCLLLSDSCVCVDMGCSLSWENRSVVYICCWPSPAQSFSGPSPIRIMTILYCLRFETSLWLNELSLSLILQPAVSRPVYLGIKHISGAYNQIFNTVRQLQVCWCEAPSLTRGWVCHLQLLLALASGVTFGSESRGTRYHILLSHFRDFHFCHLLWLAGLQWRYSTPPPYRGWTWSSHWLNCWMNSLL